MDRMPTTSERTLAGNREAAASPLTGAPPGRWGDRKVSEASQPQRPGAIQWHAAGNVVRPAEVHVGIRSRIATEIRSSSRLANPTASPDTQTPSTSSEATASCDLREQPATLPQPSPTPSHRRFFQLFVDWCEVRNVQYWPASPETVADCLRDRADRYCVKTLRSIERAISDTHFGAGLDDPCAPGLVSMTIHGLAKAKGEDRGWINDVSGSFPDSAQLDSIRAVAFEPRPRGRGLESPETTRRRGQVDLALCSVVLEAGLDCDQAEDLQWGDLGFDANLSPTLTIRARSSGADEVIRISERAFDDLMTIAPEPTEADQRIFMLFAQRIRERVMAARAAALRDGVAGARPRRSVHTGTSDTNLATDRVRDCPARLERSLTPRMLNQGAIQAIRATACNPRQRGAAVETVAAARRRGLTDIALCSLLHAARMAAETVAVLKWGDVKKLDKDKTEITVRRQHDPPGNEEHRVITGEAVRDLEAIRGDSGPEDRVLRLSVSACYRHVKSAVKAAGLGTPG